MTKPFAIGDLVKQKYDNRVGTITRVWSVGEIEWLVEYDHGSVVWIREAELEMVRSVNAVCSCGARFTSRPSFHLDWCDIK